MANNLKKTKIVATVGPAVCQKIWSFADYKDPKNAELVQKAHQLMEGIIKAGVNVIRFNFSHGTTEEQAVRAQMARAASEKLNTPISLLLDTKGPEIRVGKINNKECPITKGAIVVIEALKKIEGTSERFSVTDSTGKYNMANDLKVGSLVLVDDGKLFLKVTGLDKAAGKITCVAENAHVLKENKRINLPGAKYSMPFLSAKDQTDVKYACAQKFDYIAASFVNNAQNIRDIKKITKAAKSDIKIIAKIESTEAIKNLDAIIKESDGIMVARGDLGIEIPYYEVPYYETYMIKQCRKFGKPCIVATQMLDSMERNLLATRAEVTDVWYSVTKGTDATMTSGETAQGLFPVETISTMTKINQAAELTFNYDRSIKNFNKSLFKGESSTIALAIAKKTAPTNQKTVKAVFPYELVVLFNDNDQVIKAVSNIRPGAHVIVVTDQKDQYTKYGTYYGVTTYLVGSLSAVSKDQKELKTTFNKIVKQYAVGSKKAIAYVNKKFVTFTK